MPPEQDHPTTADLMRKRGYVSTEEAAQRIGRTPQYIRNCIHDGVLKSVRFGRGPHAPIFVKWSSLVDHVGPDAAQILGFDKKSC